MGKGRIIADLGGGLYTLEILNNRGQADKMLAAIEAKIILIDNQMSACPVGDPKRSALALSKASLLEQKGYLLRIPNDEIFGAWCSDLTEGLSGIVGTIEINGNPLDNVNIRPGYTDQAAYLPARDGQSMNIRVMTPAQAFYFLAMTPGFLKWLPTYRIGTIETLDVDTCSITLDDANCAIKGAEYNINQAWDLTDVGIEYMDCNGAAFEVGDRVIVSFIKQDFKKPVVIGFESNPKPCDSDIYFFQPYSIGTSNFLGVYNIHGVCIFTYDINQLVGASADKAVYVDDVNRDLNAVIIRGSKLWHFLPAQGGDMWLGCDYRCPVVWMWLEDNLHEVLGFRNCNSLSMMSPGGYSVGMTQTILAGWKIEQDLAHVNFQIVPAKWTDADMDTIMDDNEVYPADYLHRITNIRGVAWHFGELIMAVYRGYDPAHPLNFYTDAAMVDCFIGVFTGPEYIDQLWYYQSDPNWIDTYLERKIVDITTVAEFERISRIICYDGRMFIFKNSPTAIELYDMYGDMLAMCSPAEPGGCTKPYILNYNGKIVLCTQWYQGGYKSPVVFYDIDNLDVVYTVVIPGSIETSNSIEYLTLAATNRPIMNGFILAYNIKRRTYTPPLKPVSYSAVAALTAQEHADWCVANSKIEFNENSIDTHERQREYGIFNGGTILNYIVSGSQSDEYDMVLSYPGFALLTDIESIGLGVATFPSSCTSFTFFGFQIDIPVNQRGMFKVYVCDYFWY